MNKFHIHKHDDKSLVWVDGYPPFIIERPDQATYISNNGVIPDEICSETFRLILEKIYPHNGTPQPKIFSVIFYSGVLITCVLALVLVIAWQAPINVNNTDPTDLAYDESHNFSCGVETSQRTQETIDRVNAATERLNTVVAEINNKTIIRQRKTEFGDGATKEFPFGY